MVKIGHMTFDTAREIRNVAYVPPADKAQFELMSVAELQRRVANAELHQHQRADFDLTIVCTAGLSWHEVDFNRIELRPNRVVSIRAGQVHRWGLADAGFDGWLLLSATHDALGPRSATAIDLATEEWADLRPIVTLARRRRQTGPAPIPVQEAMHTLLRHALVPERHRTLNAAHSPIFADFVQAMEHDASHSRSVQHFATQLGCSARTLTRVSLDAEGKTAKQLIDERVILQAKRLLSLSGHTAATVASELEFSESTNFAKFFKRHTSETPGEWQRANRQEA